MPETRPNVKISEDEQDSLASVSTAGSASAQPAAPVGTDDGRSSGSSTNRQHCAVDAVDAVDATTAQLRPEARVSSSASLAQQYAHGLEVSPGAVPSSQDSGTTLQTRTGGAEIEVETASAPPATPTETASPLEGETANELGRPDSEVVAMEIQLDMDAAATSGIEPTGSGSGTILVLASGSPARAATLRAAGIEPMIQVSNADEDAVLAQFADPGSAAQADEKVVALAEAKSAAVLPDLSAERLLQFARAQGVERPQAAIVVACDSMLEVNGALVGKPHSPELARERIRELSGNDVVLHTGHAVSLIHIEYSDAGADSGANGTLALDGSGSGAGAGLRVGTGLRLGGVKSSSCSTTVHFSVLDDAEIEGYITTGEPLEVAGAFTIDGLGGPFIEGVTGDPHSVVGISLPLLRQIAKDLGVFWPSLWNRLAR